MSGLVGGRAGASTASARARRGTARSEQPERPRLRLIDRRSLRRRSVRRNLYLGASLLFVLGLFAVALAQAQLVQGQHELDGLQDELADLEEERDRLAREVDRSSAPEVIVGRARAMGMVRAADPVYFSAVRPLQEPAASPNGAAQPDGPAQPDGAAQPDGPAQPDATTAGAGG